MPHITLSDRPCLSPPSPASPISPTWIHAGSSMPVLSPALSPVQSDIIEEDEMPGLPRGFPEKRSKADPSRERNADLTGKTGSCRYMAPEVRMQSPI